MNNNETKQDYFNNGGNFQSDTNSLNQTPNNTIQGVMGMSLNNGVGGNQPQSIPQPFQNNQGIQSPPQPSPQPMPSNTETYNQPQIEYNEPSPQKFNFKKPSKKMIFIIIGVVLLLLIIILAVLGGKDDANTNNTGDINQTTTNNNNTSNNNNNNNNTTNSDSSDSRVVRFNEYGEFTKGVIVKVTGTEVTNSLGHKNNNRLIINVSVKNNSGSDILIYPASSGYDLGDPANKSIFNLGDSASSLALLAFYVPASADLKNVKQEDIKQTFVSVHSPSSLALDEQVKLKNGEEMNAQLHADINDMTSNWGTDYQPYVMYYKPTNTYFTLQ